MLLCKLAFAPLHQAPCSCAHVQDCNGAEKEDSIGGFGHSICAVAHAHDHRVMCMSNPTNAVRSPLGSTALPVHTSNLQEVALNEPLLWCSPHLLPCSMQPAGPAP
eukprot:scaffold224282_cov17-Tisochrysis_lutea.AAC.1